MQGGEPAGVKVTCRRVEIEDLVERYVAGHLPEALRAAFEEHYFGCDRCARLVTVATALAEALSDDRIEGAGEDGASTFKAGGRTSSSSVGAADGAGLPRIARGAVVALAAALAVGVLGLSYLSRGDGGGTARADAELRALGRVDELPPYVPARLRGGSGGEGLSGAAAGSAPDSARRLYLEGMERYAAGDLAGARALLERSVTFDGTRPVARYYLGAVLLASDRPDGAIPHLRRARSEPALAPDAGWYLSRAFLAAGEPDSALSLLNRLVASEGEPGERARVLRDRVRAALGYR